LKSKTRRWLIVLPLLVVTIACDLTSKRIAVEMLEGLGAFSYLGGTVVLLYSENTGAFLGLGSGLDPNTRFWLFTVGVSALLLVFGYKLLRASHGIELAGWSLIIGGGLGNLVDRVLNDGHVIDFMRVGLGRLRTGIFNVADAAIVVGLVALLFASFVQDRPAESR